MARGLIVLLHGWCGDGAGLRPWARAWSAVLPGVIFATPDAPHPGSRGVGRQWFETSGIHDGNRAARVMQARAGFDEAIVEALAAHGFADQLDRVALFGFSQGAILALDAVVRGRWPVAGVVGYAGRLAPAEPVSPALSTRIRLIHGERDDVIPVRESAMAQAELQRLGFRVERDQLPRETHRISPAGSGIASRALADMLGLAAQSAPNADD